MSFAAAYGGERVLANILIPKNAAPPNQAVIWFPGSYALEPQVQRSIPGISTVPAPQCFWFLQASLLKWFVFTASSLVQIHLIA
ncbi:MAG: hypothetical protein AABN33_04530 [Acidobacteriota bacterium]